jgi:DNA-binding MarR family transcriptional regulator
VTPDPPPSRAGDARTGTLIALGAELQGLFDRLARRQGNVSLIQLRALSALAAHAPEPLEPWEIARLLGIGSNHVTVVLDQLVTRGLARREPHPHDRRRRLVHPTPTGIEIARRLAAHAAALEERIMGSALTDAEREALDAIAAKLRAALARAVVPDTRQRPGP